MELPPLFKNKVPSVLVYTLLFDGSLLNDPLATLLLNEGLETSNWRTSVLRAYVHPEPP